MPCDSPILCDKPSRTNPMLCDESGRAQTRPSHATAPAKPPHPYATDPANPALRDAPGPVMPLLCDCPCQPRPVRQAGPRPVKSTPKRLRALKKHLNLLGQKKLLSFRWNLYYLSREVWWGRPGLDPPRPGRSLLNKKKQLPPGRCSSNC